MRSTKSGRESIDPNATITAELCGATWSQWHISPPFLRVGRDLIAAIVAPHDDPWAGRRGAGGAEDRYEGPVWVEPCRSVSVPRMAGVGAIEPLAWDLTKVGNPYPQQSFYLRADRLLWVTGAKTLGEYMFPNYIR